MKLIVGLLLMVPMLFWLVARISVDVLFDWHCSEYLSRAAHASSIEIAEQSLTTAIDYAERNHLTSGNTGILFRTPKNDIGFWYTNLVSARAELDAAKKEGTSLAATNGLMKLREVLTGHGDHGTSLIMPAGMAVAPNNAGWCVACWLVGILTLAGIAMIFVFVAEDQG